MLGLYRAQVNPKDKLRYQMQGATRRKPIGRFGMTALLVDSPTYIHVVELIRERVSVDP